MIAGLMAVLPLSVSAQQMPVVQTKYTADPAPMLHNDTIFLYTSHDEDNAEGFLMKNWLLVHHYRHEELAGSWHCGRA